MMLLICKTDFRDVKIRMCLKNRCKITHFLSNPKKGKAKKCCKPSFFFASNERGDDSSPPHTDYFIEITLSLYLDGVP
jgi:hypothetical protein